MAWLDIYGNAPAFGNRRGPSGGGTLPAPFAAVAANGWQADYAATPPALNPLTDFTVMRAGYDETGSATAHADVLTVTQRARQPYPAHASLTALTCALSDHVYAADALSGGATNGSAETSPKPIANWLTTDRQVVGNSLTVELVAFHRDARNGKPVACVKGTASDGTTTVNALTATPIVLGAAWDRCAVIGYRLSFDISGLANQALVTVNAQVFPWVGVAASVLDSSAGTPGTRDFRPLVFLRHTGKAASPPFAYVNATTGLDATVNASGIAGGVTKVSTDAATAAANPFATVVSAMSALVAASGVTGGFTDGCIIRAQGTVPIGTSMTVGTYQDKGEVILEGDPADAMATYSFGGSTPNFRQSYIRFRNVRMLRTGAQSPPGGSTVQTVFENVALDAGGFANALMGTSGSCWINGMTIANPGAGLLGGASGKQMRMLRGVSISDTAVANSLDPWLIVGCEVNCNTGGILTAVFSHNKAITAFNRFMRVGLTSHWYQPGAAENLPDGFVFAQNVVEWISANSAAFMRASGDSASGNITHAILWNNTLAGFFNSGRGNLFYDESTAVRTHKLLSLRGNIHVAINCKGDVFKADGTHIGNWPYKYAVGCRNEWSQFIDANSEGAGSGSSFAQDYPGAGAHLGSSSSVRNDPLFVNYQGTTSGGAGTGGGNYALQAGSPCRGLVAVAQEALPFDITGAPRTTGSVGAYA